MTEYAFLNNKLIPTDEATVSIQDAGLLHAVGLFETLRSYGATVFRLDDHLDRLFSSASALGLTLSQDRCEITDGITSLLKANNLTSARLRLTATSGNITEIREDDHPISTLIITTAPIPEPTSEPTPYGVMVLISPHKQNPDDPLTGHKTTACFPRLISLQQAQQKKASESLWFTTTNRLAGAAMSNVFLVHGGRLLTPALDTPAMQGITRGVVLELARQNGIACEERELQIRDVLDAEEVFLTNTIMEMIPVSRIERHVVGDEAPGPVYHRLHDLFRQTVNMECAIA